MSKKCEHCWHMISQHTDFATHITYICCFCGETKKETIENTGSDSYSYDESKHGPYYKLKVWY